MLISNPHIEKTKQEIKKSKQPIIVKSQNNDYNRKLLEYGKFQILLLKYEKTRDKLKKLDSNLNHVLAKIATKNKIAIAYDLNELRKLDKKDKAIFLSRITQNLKICRKARTQVKFLNIKDNKDAQSLLLSLGASSQQAKQATS